MGLFIMANCQRMNERRTYFRVCMCPIDVVTNLWYLEKDEVEVRFS